MGVAFVTSTFLFALYAERLDMFCINDNKGFQLTFDNGCTLSVQFGPGNYTDPELRQLPLDAPQGKMQWKAKTAEIAIILPDGEFYPLEAFGDDVAGWQAVEDVCRWIDVARNIKTEVSS